MRSPRAATPTLAVDIPSGVDGATGEIRGEAVRADETVSFAALKPGLLFEPGRSRAGRVHVVDIGIDIGATRGCTSSTPPTCVFPRRSPDAHKWASGALIVGGSTGMIGAPLDGEPRRGPVRGGHGRVRASGRRGGGASLDAASSWRGPSRRRRTARLDADAAGVVLKDVERFHVVAIGPGLGRDERTQAAVRQIVAECPAPIVVDADALNALAVDLAPLRQRHARRVPSRDPHAARGRVRAAGGHARRRRPAGRRARDLAARHGRDRVAEGPGHRRRRPDGDAVVNRTDTPALATAGTGDVLTGIIAGLVANGASPFDAAATGAYVHGRAAHDGRHRTRSRCNRPHRRAAPYAGRVAVPTRPLGGMNARRHVGARRDVDESLLGPPR